MGRGFSPSFYIFMWLCVGVFVTLGAWQVRRLAWKEQILSAIEREKNTDATAVHLTPNDLTSLGRYDIKRGTLAGHFITGKDILWRGQIVNAAPVVYLVAPFVLKTGMIVPVVLGSKPDDKQTITIPARKTPDRKITGTAKIAKDNMFRPPNDPSKNIWYRMDGDDLKQYWGKDISPALFYADSKIVEGVEPINTALNVPNNHKQYAVFWFAMAALVGGLTIFTAAKNK